MAMSASKDRPGVEVPRIWCKRKCFEIVASIRLRTAKTQNAEAPIFGCGGAPASALSPRRSEHRRPLPPVRRRGYLVEGFHRVPRARVATSCKVCRLCGTGVRNDARQIFRLARLPAAGRGRQDLIQSQFRADLCRFLAAPRLLTRSIGFCPAGGVSRRVYKGYKVSMATAAIIATAVRIVAGKVAARWKSNPLAG